MFQVVKRWKGKRLFLSSALFEKGLLSPGAVTSVLELSRAQAYMVLVFGVALCGPDCRGWKLTSLGGASAGASLQHRGALWSLCVLRGTSFPVSRVLLLVCIISSVSSNKVNRNFN